MEAGASESNDVTQDILTDSERLVRFLRYRWEGYNEALVLYVLGLGSPTHPLPETSYPAWTRTFRWKRLYGHELLYAGPLFIHQLSHMWIDFRGIHRT